MVLLLPFPRSKGKRDPGIEVALESVDFLKDNFQLLMSISLPRKWKMAASAASDHNRGEWRGTEQQAFQKSDEESGIETPSRWTGLLSNGALLYGLTCQIFCGTRGGVVNSCSICQWLDFSSAVPISNLTRLVNSQLVAGCQSVWLVWECLLQHIFRMSVEKCCVKMIHMVWPIGGCNFF